MPENLGCPAAPTAAGPTREPLGPRPAGGSRRLLQAYGVPDTPPGTRCGRELCWAGSLGPLVGPWQDGGPGDAGRHGVHCSVHGRPSSPGDHTGCALHSAAGVRGAACFCWGSPTCHSWCHSLMERGSCSRPGQAAPPPRVLPGSPTPRAETLSQASPDGYADASALGPTARRLGLGRDGGAASPGRLFTGPAEYKVPTLLI